MDSRVVLPWSRHRGQQNDARLAAGDRSPATARPRRRLSGETWHPHSIATLWRTKLGATEISHCLWRAPHPSAAVAAGSTRTIGAVPSAQMLSEHAGIGESAAAGTTVRRQGIGGCCQPKRGVKVAWTGFEGRIYGRSAWNGIIVDSRMAWGGRVSKKPPIEEKNMRCFWSLNLLFGRSMVASEAESYIDSESKSQMPLTALHLCGFLCWTSHKYVTSHGCIIN